MQSTFAPIRETKLQFFSLFIGLFIGAVAVTMSLKKDIPPKKEQDCSTPIKILKWNGAIVSSIEVLKKLPEGVKAISELDIEVRKLLSEPSIKITDNELEELNRNISEYYELGDTSQPFGSKSNKLSEISYNVCNYIESPKTINYRIPEGNKLDILFCQLAPNFSVTDKP